MARHTFDAVIRHGRFAPADADSRCARSRARAADLVCSTVCGTAADDAPAGAR